MSKMFPNSDHVADPSTTKPEPQTALGGKDPVEPKAPEPSRIYKNSDHSEPLGNPNSSSADTDARPSASEQHKPSPGGSAEDDPNKPATDNPMNVPDDIAEMRKNATFDADATYAESLPDDVLTNPELTDELREAATKEFRAMAGDLALPPAELESFVALAKHTEANPPTEEQQTAWRDESLRALEKFGDVDQALRDANALFNRDPRVKALVRHYGLLNHPRVVELFVTRARAERAKGRLK